jgi:hypothetical protein
MGAVTFANGSLIASVGSVAIETGDEGISAPTFFSIPLERPCGSGDGSSAVKKMSFEKKLSRKTALITSTTKNIHGHGLRFRLCPAAPDS